jgi:hypothetical protein
MMAEITTFCAFSLTAGGKSAPMLFNALNALAKPPNTAPNTGIAAIGLLLLNSFGGIILG